VRVQEELVGKPIQTISRTDKETLFIILVNIFAKPPSPVGDLWATVQTWQHKNGTPLMLRLRHQLFYNQLWQVRSPRSLSCGVVRVRVRWCVCVCVGVR
jgi:hypothetical protein